MKRYLDPEIQKLKENINLHRKQAVKCYNYRLDEFEIVPINNKETSYKWRHKTWRTWLKGGNSIVNTVEIVNRYIDECRKPYGQRNIDFIHIAD